MLLTNGFDPDVRVYKEAAYLVHQGFNVSILCWDRDISRNHPKKEDLDGIHIIRYKIPSVYGTKGKQIPAFIKYIRCCKKYLKRHGADYLHCNDIDGAVTGYLSRCKHTPMVFDMHEFYEHGSNVQRLVWRKIVIFFLKRSIAGIYENSAYLDDTYKTVKNKLYPLRNYPDSNMIQALPKTKSNVFRIAYHGVVRGQIREFTALAEAVKDMDDVRVDINGGGQDLQELKIMQQSYDNVFVNGPYNGITESSRLYANTDVLFCCYDAMNPNYQGDAEVVKFYEAIRTGTPMIMTAGIGMAEKITQNNFGLVCDTLDPSSIRSAISKMKSNKSEWLSYRINELSKASSYSWEKAVKVLDNIYK